MLAPAADRTVARTDNNPPGPLASAKEAMAELAGFLKEHPVIQSAVEAKEGGAFVERSRIAIDALEKERDGKVRPLNTQVYKINADYKLVREPLERAAKLLRARLTDYARAEEEKRIAEAERLRREAEEKAHMAREAERAEQDAIACADVGECTDVAAAIEEADLAFADYRKADRKAAIAERDVPVRIGSVMGNRAMAMRTIEVLTVADAAAAITAIGLTDKIRDAILSSARDFRKAHGELPRGVTADFKRSL